MTLQLTDAVAEIFYEIVSHMETALRFSEGKLTQQYDAEGSKLLWHYAKSWTEEFVRENPDSTSWDGDFIDNVEAFVKQKIENLQ